MKWESSRARTYDFATGLIYVTYGMMALGGVWLLFVLLTRPFDREGAGFLVIWLFSQAGLQLIFRAMRWLHRPPT